MCGIVGAIANRDVVPILIDGLKRLEYRGYDSAGAAVINDAGTIHRARKPGKVKELETEADKMKLHGNIGIAIRVGQPTANQPSPMHILIFVATKLLLFTMVLSRTMKNYVNNKNNKVMNLLLKLTPK